MVERGAPGKITVVIDIEWRGDVAILRWHDGENRFHRASVQRWHEVLDELDAREEPLALVLTGDGKFFSNGLDLDAFAADPDSAGAVLDEVHRLFGRLLVFGAYVVAALNGHTFAAGAMLACCADQRVMREDRGYWSLPEADLGLPLTDAMFAAVTSRMPTATAAEAMNTARRYTAPDALAAGIIDATAPESEVLERAVAIAEPMAAKNRRVIAQHKAMLFGAAAATCGHTV